MTYRVALLTLASIAILGCPLGKRVLAIEDDYPSMLAQTPQSLDPAATEPEAAPEESGDANPRSAPPPSKEIETLQQQLGRLGYYQGPMDGILGPETGEAISLFQRDAGLATTGLPDPLTLQRLQSTENPLGIIPDVSQLETDSTDSDAAVDSPAASEPTEVTEADAASTPLDGSAAEADALLEETPVNTADADAVGAQNGGGLIRLALVGMIVVAMGTAGAVAFLFLFRRPASSPDLDSEVATGEATPAAMPEMAAASGSLGGMETTSLPDFAAATTAPSTAAPPMPVADAPRNGHNPIKDTFPLPQAVSPTSALVSETPTKLVPVNIIDELVQDLQSSDPAQRRKAIWELGQRGNSTAVQPLTRLMLDADSKERSLILAALAEISTQTLKPMNRALALSLQDENPEVRKNAIRDMTRIYDLMSQAGTMLNHAASDSDPEVRQTATWAMDQLNRMRLNVVNPDAPSLQGHSGSVSDPHSQDSSAMG